MLCIITQELRTSCGPIKSVEMVPLHRMDISSYKVKKVKLTEYSSSQLALLPQELTCHMEHKIWLSTCTVFLVYLHNANSHYN